MWHCHSAKHLTVFCISTNMGATWNNSITNKNNNNKNNSNNIFLNSDTEHYHLRGSGFPFSSISLYTRVHCSSIVLLHNTELLGSMLYSRDGESNCLMERVNWEKMGLILLLAYICTLFPLSTHTHTYTHTHPQTHARTHPHTHTHTHTYLHSSA